ncbi:MAG: branched-chain amino acid ABC transporter permease [Bacillota bacterium]|nr:branched-chain amino acid ABC transporter permease [Bacillota bacterium]MDD3297385.1 branched-chain amino acid ABC transporter permease [Bacillota bacterium]MDD3850643.1 branched-chain amino acid ABC transporter permease [Bacillota bacterium]MDD4707110.1 branched-chain amino acid ABC transporter permease [Bacillota bacterium]
MDWFYVKGILILSGINLMAVLGLSLLTGFTGLFSFGHAGFMAIGAYVTAMGTMKLGLPFIPALLLGAAGAAVVSFFIGRLTLNLKGDYFCIATLGFGEAIRLILDNVQYFGGARGWPGLPVVTNLTTVVIVDVIGVVILANIIRSRHGRNFKAIREEEMASQTIGINVFRYKMAALMISAAYAGVAGGMLAHLLGFIQPKMFQFIKSTELTITVIFGGLGSISGSVIGALVLTSLPELLRTFASWRLVVYGAAVVFIMISRPQGLMGGTEITFTNIKKLFSRFFRASGEKAGGGGR